MLSSQYPQNSVGTQPTSSNQTNQPPIPLLSSKDAFQLDQELFQIYSLDQLVELAGLTAASALHKIIADPSHGLYSTSPKSTNLPCNDPSLKPSKQPNSKNILVICGPGNNGADGLVLARHCKLWGYDVTILAPRLLPQLETSLGITFTPTTNPTDFITGENFTRFNSFKDDKSFFYQKLLLSCLVVGCGIIPTDSVQNYISDLIKYYSSSIPQGSPPLHDIVVDSVFGFSFTAAHIDDIRSPFRNIITLMSLISTQSPCTTVLYSIDVPSGWHVDHGDILNTNINPHAVISLTAPKPCAVHYTNVHIIGGRFLPPFITEKYNLSSLIASFHGNDQFFIVDPSKHKFITNDLNE